jgi:hypothetical protein
MVTRRFPKLNGDGWHEAVHEIIGWGNLGLIEAPSKITLSRGFRLSTVANQWVRKYAYDGIASLVSVIHYPERKRELARFDSQIVTTEPEGDEFEVFDSFGNPTNKRRPPMPLHYYTDPLAKLEFTRGKREFMPRGPRMLQAEQPGEICYLDNRCGRYNSWEYVKTNPYSPTPPKLRASHHWRNTAPFASDYLRRGQARRLERRANLMFLEARSAAEKFNERMGHEGETSEPICRKAA